MRGRGGGPGKNEFFILSLWKMLLLADVGFICCDKLKNYQTRGRAGYLLWYVAEHWLLWSCFIRYACCVSMCPQQFGKGVFKSWFHARPMVPKWTSREHSHSRL